MIEPFYNIFLLRYFANCEQCKSQKLDRELFLVTKYLWNAICKHLLPRDPVNVCAVRIPDLLLVIGSSLVYGLSELCGPFGENGKKYPCERSRESSQGISHAAGRDDRSICHSAGVTPQSAPSTVQELEDRQVARWLGRRAEQTC